MPPNSRDFIKKKGKNNYKGGGTRPKHSKENIKEIKNRKHKQPKNRLRKSVVR